MSVEEKKPPSIKQVALVVAVVVPWCAILSTILLPLMVVGMITDSKRISAIITYPLDKLSKKLIQMEREANER